MSHGQKIEQIDIYVLKLNRHYRVGGHAEMPNRVPGTDYYFEPQWRQAYSGKTESCVVKITTASGVEGWGEAQAPLVPEVPGTLAQRLLGPAILGFDALAHECLYDRLYHMMTARGQQYGFYLDTMAAIDIALWDIRGKVWQAPICALLGGPFRTELSGYVSGLRRPDREQRLALARQCIADGYAGVKVFSGQKSSTTLEEFTALREAVDNDAFLALDAINAHDLPTALSHGKTLDNLGAAWFEAPVASDDIAGHARVGSAMSTPVAAGETLRSAAQFLPWLQADALGIAQPDVVRCGITAAKRIADLAEVFHRKTALHLGVCTGIGVAATWQVAAALPGFYIQEHQLELFDTANQILEQGLAQRAGKLQVPQLPGLGITVKQSAIDALSTQHWKIRSD